MPNYRRRNTKPIPQKTQEFKLNREIRSEQVRVIDENNEMVGVMSASEALHEATKRELDLVEINPKSLPPVVKIIAWSKFKYQQQKKTDKIKAPKTELKNIRVSVRTSIHDLEVRARKIAEFLDEGHKVRIDVNMRGREQQYPEIAFKQINQFLEVVGKIKEYGIESTAKQVGSRFTCTITPQKTVTTKPVSPANIENNAANNTEQVR
jgi:translation initiation factor IF-3